MLKRLKAFHHNFPLLKTLPPKSLSPNPLTFLPKQAFHTKVQKHSFSLFTIQARSFHERLREGQYSSEIQQIIKEFGSDSLEMANFLETKAIELHQRQENEDALEMALIAKNIYKNSKMSASEYELLDLIAETSFQMQNFDQSISAIKEHIQLKEMLHGEHYPSNSGLYYKLGSVYFHVGSFKEALTSFQKAFELVKEAGEKEVDQASYFFYFIALTQYNLRQFEDAKMNAEKALEHYEKAGDQKIIYLCSRLLGLICEEMKDIDSGAMYFKRALLAAEEAYDSNSQEMALIYYLIGKAEYQLDRIDHAIKYTTRSLNVYEKISDKNPIDVADALYNLSLMHYKKKDFEKALKDLEGALEIYVVHKDKKDIKLALAYENKGLILESLSRDDEALEALNQAISICDQHKETENLQIAKIYYNIARFYLELFPEKLDLVNQYIQKAAKIASNQKDAPLYKEIQLFIEFIKKENS